jgi:hypothetical protein
MLHTNSAREEQSNEPYWHRLGKLGAWEYYVLLSQCFRKFFFYSSRNAAVVSRDTQYKGAQKWIHTLIPPISLSLLPFDMMALAFIRLISYSERTSHYTPYIICISAQLYSCVRIEPLIKCYTYFWALLHLRYKAMQF